MTRSRRFRLAAPLICAAALAAGGSLFTGAAPAEAQCLSQAQCNALRAQLEEYRDEARARKREMRNLRQQIHSLSPDNPRRAELMQQFRALRREAKQQRRGARPLKRRYVQGCKRC